MAKTKQGKTFSGERLAEMRAFKGWSQGELAQKLNVKPKTISAYETGAISPGDQVKFKIAQVSDITLDYYMCLIDDALPCSRDGYIALPKDCPEQLKTELLNHLQLLKKAYGIK